MKKIVILLSILLSISAAAQEVLGPETIPAPPLDTVEPRVREQLQEARGKLVDLHADASTSPATLGQAFGELGMLYLEYGFLDAAEISFRNAQSFLADDYRWPYYLGVLLEEKGRYEEAIQSFKRVLELRRGDLPTVLRLANLHLELNQPQLAHTLYTAALESDLGQPAAHAGLGRIAFDAGDFQAAIDHFEAALAAQPKAVALHHQLGLAHRELGQLDEARQHLAQSGEHEVVFPDPLMIAVDELGQGAGSYLTEGIAAAQEGDFERAAEAYRKAVTMSPDHLEARRSLATALTQLGDLDGAIEQFEAILERAPDKPLVYQSLATVQLQKGGMDQEAIRNLRKAVELDPEFKSGLLDLATALATHGEPEEALIYFSRLLELDPRESEAHLRKSYALNALGRSDEAIAQLEKLLELEPEHVAALIFLAEVYAIRGDVDAARARLEEVVNLPTAPRPRIAQAYFRLALLEQNRGAVEKALELYRYAIQVGPRLKDAQYNLATLLAATGQPEESIPHFEKVVEIDPDDQSARYRLAVLLEQLGEKERALEHFEILRAARPRHLEFAVRSAHLKAQLSEYDEARKLLEEASSYAGDDEDRSRLYGQMALVERLHGDEEAALGLYRRAAATAPALASAQRELARAYGRLERYSQAAAEYRRYLELQPDDPEAHFELAMTHVLANEPAAARDVLDRGLERTSDLRLAHLLARLLATSTDETVRDGERALELATSVFETRPDPAHDETVAMALAALGRFDDALALQRTLVEEAEKRGLPPGFIQRAKDNLARYEQGQLAEAHW